MTETFKGIAPHLFAFAVLGAAFYGLVVYPFTLDPLVQGALIAWGGAAIAFEFGQAISKQSAAQTTQALNTPVPGTTVTPPTNGATVTTVTSAPATPPLPENWDTMTEDERAKYAADNGWTYVPNS